jgi:hypothetical protein
MQKGRMYLPALHILNLLVERLSFQASRTNNTNDSE